ncbi:WG repeat-containing protein [Natronincola ferrireducens]|uniref:WG containing repeat-containing protein n=1 Tax=Natronincola ferrireducens TaxID=393762 RepID=A0A1G9GZA8_9FIRM|nr:WG repeat-containing protein [Natronincola ferrireducens]SDL05935.1 WG containing repeat-containing protein [Natronincola ferrireducens]
MKNKRKMLFPLCIMFLITILYGIYNMINSTNEVTTLFIVKDDNKYEITDKNGKNILRTHSHYHFIDRIYEDYARVMQFSKWGFINEKGIVQIPIKYDYVLDFSEGYAGIKKDGKWGFIDQSGNIAIEPKYDWVSSFKNEVAVVSINNKHFFINKSGDKLYNKNYSFARNFSEGKALVYSEDTNTSFYIDKNGLPLFSVGSNKATDFIESRAIITYNDMDGNEKSKIIDEHNNVICDGLDYITSFNNGRAFYGIREDENIKWGLIDTNGNKITEAIFNNANINSQSHYSVSILNEQGEEKWGFINTFGEFVIEPEYDFAGEFYGDFATVSMITPKGTKWGIIDSSENFVIEPKYDLIYPYK